VLSHFATSDLRSCRLSSSPASLCQPLTAYGFAGLAKKVGGHKTSPRNQMANRDRRRNCFKGVISLSPFHAPPSRFHPLRPHIRCSLPSHLQSLASLLLHLVQTISPSIAAHNHTFRAFSRRELRSPVPHHFGQLGTEPATNNIVGVKRHERYRCL